MHFYRSGGSVDLTGNKLVGTGATAHSSRMRGLGRDLGDGTRLPWRTGITWTSERHRLLTRTGEVWTQQGEKIVEPARTEIRSKEVSWDWRYRTLYAAGWRRFDGPPANAGMGAASVLRNQCG